MNTEALLTLTQWMSPGFPVGAFAYSHGLEHVIDRGALCNAADLQIWLEDILWHGGAKSDVVILAASYHAAPGDIAKIDQTARAFAASQERLTETVDQGAAFSRTVDAIWNTDMGPLCYPVAVGRAAKARSLPLVTAANLYTHALLANLVSAAVRLVPLGQTDGQMVLANLAPQIEDMTASAVDLQVEDLTSNCFALDIAAMQHETQYSKVFRT